MEGCKRGIGHKIGTVVSVTIALGAAVFVFYYFAAQLEEDGMVGIVPFVDHYLRWSAVAFFGAALLTYVMTFFDLKPTRIVLMVVSGLVLLDLLFALLAFFACRGFLVSKYKRFFDTAKYAIMAEEFEKEGMCCGWTGALELVHTADCAWNITCDTVMLRRMGGLNTVVFGAGIGGALGLMIYVLVAQILMMQSSVAGYGRLEEGTP